MLNDKIMIETNLSKEIRTRLYKKNCVLLVGNSGSGASSILRHIALALVKENKFEEFDIIPVVIEPSTVLQYYDRSRNQIFVLDDFCGKDRVNYQLADVWKLDINKILHIINENGFCENDLKNKKTKFLISCNTSVYNSRIFEDLKKLLETFVCRSSEFPLTHEEMECMIKLYSPNAEVNDIMDKRNPIRNFDFPLLCKLSTGKTIDEIYQLFSDPLRTIKSELKKVQSENNLQFCAIALCTLFDNKFKIEWLNVNSEENVAPVRDAVNEICLEFNLEITNDIDLKRIQDQFGQEQIDWLKKSTDTYHHIHYQIFKIASVLCGESYTQCFINHAPSSFIAQWFHFGESNDDGLISLVGKKYEKQYFDRLFRDLEHGLGTSTFQNVQLKIVDYRQKFINYCRHRESKFKEVLRNLQINQVNKKTNFKTAPFCADCNCRKGPFCVHDISLNVPLVDCARLGYNDIVTLLLDMKCNVNETDGFGRSALYIASTKGHIDVVKRLVENHADLDLSDNKKMTSLHMACSEGHENIVEYLIKNKADVCALDTHGNTPLHIACASGKTNIIQFLLKEKENEIKRCNNLGQTPIIIASLHGQNQVIELLLELKADIRDSDNTGFTSLLTASSKGFTKTVLLLIEKGADIFHVDNDGRSSLFIACEKGNAKIVQTLVDSGMKEIIEKCNWHDKSPFYIACAKGQKDIVCTLFKKDADINKCDEDNKSPIFAACERGHNEIVKFLLENGAKIETPDSHNNLPLHIACKMGNLAIVKSLQSQSVNCLSFKNQWNETALDIALKLEHVHIVEFLKNECKENT